MVLPNFCVVEKVVIGFKDLRTTDLVSDITNYSDILQKVVTGTVELMSTRRLAKKASGFCFDWPPMSFIWILVGATECMNHGEITLYRRRSVGRIAYSELDFLKCSTTRELAFTSGEEEEEEGEKKK